MRTALRKGFREILVETREAIKVVLTPEQAAQYQQLLDERDARVEAERREEEDQK
jgi:Spy/CpxP family protein refolding chaperone